MLTFTDASIKTVWYKNSVIDTACIGYMKPLCIINYINNNTVYLQHLHKRIHITWRFFIYP